MKKYISIILSLVLLCTSIFSVPVTAAQTDVSTTELISGDFTYVVLEDGTAEVTAYYGSGKMVTIPDELTKYGDADRDGVMSVMDATQIQLFLALIIPAL